MKLYFLLIIYLAVLLLNPNPAKAQVGTTGTLQPYALIISRIDPNTGNEIEILNPDGNLPSEMLQGDNIKISIPKLVLSQDNIPHFVIFGDKPFTRVMDITGSEIARYKDKNEFSLPGQPLEQKIEIYTTVPYVIDKVAAADALSREVTRTESRTLLQIQWRRQSVPNEPGILIDQPKVWNALLVHRLTKESQAKIEKAKEELKKVENEIGNSPELQSFFKIANNTLQQASTAFDEGRHYDVEPLTTGVLDMTKALRDYREYNESPNISSIINNIIKLWAVISSLLFLMILAYWLWKRQKRNQAPKEEEPDYYP